VSRRRAPADRRAVLVALTTEGRAAVLDHRARQLRRRRALFEHLSPADRRAAARVLARLAEAYEELST
jgi:DNA-binding MarR family transcriptional regulator